MTGAGGSVLAARRQTFSSRLPSGALRRSRCSRETAHGLLTPAVGVGGALIAAFALAGWSTPPHTELSSSEPAHDARLAEPPGSVLLVFTTEVQLALSSVEVRSEGGPRPSVTVGELVHPEDSLDALRLPIIEELGRGRYTVVWETAGPDGHRVSGRLGFWVQPTTEPPSRAVHPETPVLHGGEREGLLDQFARLLLYAGIVGVLGAVAFRVAVVPSGPRTDTGEHRAAGAAADDEEMQRLQAAVWKIAAAGSALVAITLPARLSAEAAAFPPGQRWEAVETLLYRTPWGIGWWAHCASALLIATGLLLARREGSGALGWMMVSMAALLLPLAPLLAGHGISDSPLPLSMAATYLHIGAAATWVGGLACLALAARSAAKRWPDAERFIPLLGAFSRMARVAVATLIATGALKGWLHLSSPGQLLDTEWGAALLVKIGWVAAAMLVGLYNWRVVQPSLAAAPSLRRLRASVLCEVILATVAIWATAQLVTRPL